MIEIDSIVMLKSGGPDMCVISENDNGAFACCWLDKKRRYQKEEFPYESLKESNADFNGLKKYSIELGMIVRFVKCDTKMTVISSDKHESKCVWFDANGHRQEGSFRNLALIGIPSWDDENISEELRNEKPGWPEENKE